MTGSGSPGTSPASSSRICSGSSGSSTSDVNERRPAPQSRPAVEELRTGQRDDVDRPVARPIEDVVDEVEHAVVGPLQVLEDEDDDAALRDALEEHAPCGEQRLPVGPLVGVTGLEPEQLQEVAAPSSVARRRP